MDDTEILNGYLARDRDRFSPVWHHPNPRTRDQHTSRRYMETDGSSHDLNAIVHAAQYEVELHLI
jgi:hypothetical protein